MSYAEDLQAVKDEQSDMTYEDIKERMAKDNEFITELDNLPSQGHIWIDRGLKYTCENAGHAWHEAYKRRRSL
jgi:hypothetical protein